VVRCAAIDAMIRVVARTGIPTKRIVMADSIADIMVVTTILTRDRVVYLTNNPTSKNK